MTSQPDDELDVPPFDPAKARRAVRRGTWWIAARVLAILLVLFVAVRVVDTVTTPDPSDRRTHLQRVVVPALLAMYPDVSINNMSFPNNDKAELRGTAYRSGPGSLSRDGTPFALRESVGGELSGLHLVQSAFELRSWGPVPQKSDSLALIADLPRSVFLATIELEAPVDEAGATSFRRDHGICSTRYGGGYENPLYRQDDDGLSDDQRMDEANLRTSECFKIVRRASLLSTYLTPRGFDGERRRVLPACTGFVAWPDPLLRTFGRWVATIEPDDDKQLLNKLPGGRLKCLKAVAGAPRAYGFAVNELTNSAAVKLLEDPRVRGLNLIESEADLRLPPR